MDAGALVGIGVAIVSVVAVGVVTVLTVVLTVVSVVVPFWFVFKMLAGYREAERKLMETGLAAPARVTGLSETGTTINNQPMLRIGLEIAPPGGEPFSVSIHRVCSIVHIPRLQPGAIVEVRYDATHRSNAMIVGL